ncbi:hypothetical protein Aperf_G00000052670 [Anoplocephala perfoliata]
MLASLKAENESLKASREDLVSKFQTAEKEWMLRCKNMDEELQIQKMFQLQTENTHDMIESESFLRENAQKSEISDLKSRLSEAEARVIALEAESVAVSCREVTSVATETDDNYEPPRINLSMEVDPSKSASEINDFLQLRDLTGLQRKHKAARLIIVDLVHKNAALNNDLTVCKQDLAASASIIVALTEALNSERRLRVESLEHRNSETQRLQDQISELYEDKDRCAELTNEINRLRESEERSKREHNRLLRKLDKMLQERDKAVYAKMTERCEKNLADSNKFAENGIFTSCSIIPQMNPSSDNETLTFEAEVQPIATASLVNGSIDPPSISNGIFEKTIQKLLIAFQRLQSEVAEAENPSSPKGDGDAAAFQSVHRLREVYEIIKSLLAHFSSIEEMKKSLGRTVDRSLHVNSSIKLCSDPQRVSSVKFPNQEDDENDNSSMATTIGNLRCGVVEADADCNLTYDISQEGVSRTLDVSVIEAQNREFFDRVTRAVTRIQDAIEDYSVRAAKEVLTALVDGRDVAEDAELERPLARTRSLHRTSSADTLADISRPHSISSEIAEDEQDPPNPSELVEHSNIDRITNLLTRFVDVVARIQTLGPVVDTDQPSDQSQFITPDGAAIAMEGRRNFPDWSQKAREWFRNFVYSLRNTSVPTELEMSLESLENDLFNNFAGLVEVIKASPNQTSQIDASDHADLQQRCERLEALTTELTKELDETRHEHKKEVEELRFTQSQLKSELELSMKSSSNLQAQLKDANTRINDLLNDLDQTKKTAADLQECLDKSEADLSLHRSELEKLMMRAKEFIKIESIDPNSVLAIFDSFEAEMEARIRKVEEDRKQEEEKTIQGLNELHEGRINDLEQEIKEKVEQYENKIREAEIRYASLCEVTESKIALYEERCEQFAFREEELNTELEAKAIESENLQQDVCTLQAEVDNLRRRAANVECAVGEELAKRARKYPELKAIAVDLKSRLVKRAVLLERSLNEAKRLRRIIYENDSRAKEFLEELGRLRAQILVKNSTIRQLENLALKYATGLKSPIGETKSLERPTTKLVQSASEWREFRQNSLQDITPSFSTEGALKINGTDNLCSITQPSVSFQNSRPLKVSSVASATAAITVPVLVKEDDGSKIVSSGPVFSEPQRLEINRRYRLETKRRSCTVGEMISVMNVLPPRVEQNEIGTDGQGDVGGVCGMQSFGSEDETSSVIVSVSLSSLNPVEE